MFPISFDKKTATNEKDFRRQLQWVRDIGAIARCHNFKWWLSKTSVKKRYYTISAVYSITLIRTDLCALGYKIFV